MHMCVNRPSAHISFFLNHIPLGTLRQALSGEPRAHQKASLAFQLAGEPLVFVFQALLL